MIATVIKACFKIVFPGSFETYINPPDRDAYSIMKEGDQLITTERVPTSYNFWHPELSSFHKLILIKCCKEEKVGYFSLKNCVIIIFAKAHQPVMIHRLD